MDTGYTSPYAIRTAAPTAAPRRRSTTSSAQWVSSAGAATVYSGAVFDSTMSSAGSYDYVSVPVASVPSSLVLTVPMEPYTLASSMVSLSLAGEFRATGAQPIVGVGDGTNFVGFQFGTSDPLASVISPACNIVVGTYLSASNSPYSGSSTPCNDWPTTPAKTPQNVDLTFSFDNAASAATGISVTVSSSTKYYNDLGVLENAINDVTVNAGFRPLSNGTASLKLVVFHGAGGAAFSVKTVSVSQATTAAFSFDGPVVTAIVPQKLSRSPGQTVTLYGTNFGPGPMVTQATLNDIQWDATPRRLHCHVLWRSCCTPAVCLPRACRVPVIR